MSCRMPDSPPEVRCREIRAADLNSITDLLTTGFPGPREHRVRALKIMSNRVVSEGFPRFGYMLENGTAAVGVILLICSQAPNSDAIRCNGSSWYVEPAFRTFAPLLLKKTLRYRVTHMNVSPALHTLPMIEALGFKRFCNGVFAAIPLLATGFHKTKVRRVAEAMHPERFVPAGDLQFLGITRVSAA